MEALSGARTRTDLDPHPADWGEARPGSAGEAGQLPKEDFWGQEPCDCGQQRTKARLPFGTTSKAQDLWPPPSGSALGSEAQLRHRRCPSMSFGSSSSPGRWTLTWDQAVRSAAAICRSLVLPSRESRGIWGAGRAERGERSSGGHLALLGPAAPRSEQMPGPPGVPPLPPTLPPT